VWNNNPALQRFPDAPERIRTSTTYSGHKALNLVTQGLELTYVSICRDVSAAEETTDAYREAFVITAVITPTNSDLNSPVTRC
jgi:hypothetical protein